MIAFEANAQAVAWLIVLAIGFSIAEIIGRKYYKFSIAKYILESLQDQQQTNKKRMSGPLDQMTYSCGCIVIEMHDKYQFGLKRICPKHYKLFYARKGLLLQKKEQKQENNTD